MIWIDRRKVLKLRKKFVISHTQNEILKQKNFTGSGLEETFKSFFLETIFMSKL